MTKCQEIKQKKKKKKKKQNTKKGYTVTRLQQFDGNMVTWLQQLTATKEQDCNSLASWTGRIHMVFN